MSRLLFAAVCGASILGVLPAQAQSDETIVVTGQKTTSSFGEKSGIPLEQVPQGVQVLTAEDLAARGVRSVGDALRAVPSANVGTPRTAAYQSFSLKVRGFAADQMRNGVRQRYYEDVDASALSNIERIEVLKGPSSVLFGQSALGGIVSIVTKRPQDTFAASASAVVGSHDQKAASWDVTGPLADGFSFRATGEIERSGTFVDFQDLDRENAALSLAWSPSESVSGHFVAEWIERRTQRNPGLPLVGTVLDNGLGDIPIERFLGDPGRSDLEAFSPLLQAWVDIRLSPDWTLTPRISYSELDTNFTQLRVLDVEADGVTVNRSGRFGKEDDQYAIAQLDLSGEVDLFGMRHRLLLGVEYDRERSDFYQESVPNVPAINALRPVYGVVPTRPYPLAFLFAGDIDGWAAYAQDQIDLTDRWNIVLGARFSSFETRTGFSDDLIIDAADITEDEFDHSTLQIGSTFALNDVWSVFGGYATGFDLENVAGGRSATGAPFDPEEAEQVEAGIRYIAGPVRGSASVFEIKRINVLTADPVNDGFSIQTGEVSIGGFELEGEAEIVDGLTVSGGYAHLDSEMVESNNGDQGDDLADAPKHQANIFIRYALPNMPLELRAGVNHVGERRFSNARGVEVAPGRFADRVRLPDYTIADLGAAYDFGDTRLDLAIVNLFDERYFTREFNDYSVFPGEPRQVSLRLTHDF